MDFKNIHIGEIIKIKVKESGIEMSRICNFLKSDEYGIASMYESSSLNSDLLLQWSKLLKYDFFRYFSQHLILYAPVNNTVIHQNSPKKVSELPQFRKNIYTKEIIDYILSLITSKEMTKKEVIDKYKIPKTTLYKWINKYLDNNK
ncbi:transposase [Chryseobacterium sp. GP-SGM7]|uniref:transposase n=1 Tax=Chryseobacterium sp. GP-SGM7 TaxID=3411323 RepID=UPI003B94C436